MTTIADLPDSFTPEDPLSNPAGNGAWSASSDADRRGRTMSWFGLFADYDAFEAAALYTPETVTLSAGPPPLTVTRVIPLLYPYGTGRPLYCVAVDGRAFSAEDSEAADAAPWKEVVATCRFASLLYPVTGDSAFISVRMQGEPKRITIPNYAYVLVDDSNVLVEAVAQDVGIPIFEAKIQITWHGITDLPAALGTLAPLFDHVNSNVVTLPDLGLVCAIGTLHLADASAALSVQVSGAAKAELSITLAYRTLPWNRAIGSGGVVRWVAPSGSLTSRPIAATSFAPLVGY
jgi:hypothetical protein